MDASADGAAVIFVEELFILCDAIGRWLMRREISGVVCALMEKSIKRAKRPPLLLFVAEKSAGESKLK